MQYLRSSWDELIIEHQVLCLMLFLGLIIGVIFVHLVPPWQHYDEPTHFEYAWLIANRPGLPKRGDYDQSMRREVASSMIEHNFFNDLEFIPNLISINEPIWIGISQVGSLPIYYWLSAIPLRIFRTTDVTFQLIILRYFSLLFFLITIAAAYGIANELTPPRHPLRWMLPTTILLLPGLVDILTAVNDDVGAVAFFSLFLWAGVRLLKRGFNWLRLFVLLSLALVCFYTKNTVMIAIVLVPIPVVFSIIEGKKQRIIWIGMGGLLVIASLSLITWGDPAGWYRNTSLKSASRSANIEGEIGAHVFEFDSDPQDTPAQFFQVLNGVENKNSIYTIGAWIWADQPTVAQTPILRAGSEIILDEVKVSKTPQFFSVTGELNAPGVTPKIILSPGSRSVETPTRIYYDGIIALEGSWPEDSIPEFYDGSAEGGLWGSNAFVNLVRNPSAESGRLRFRNWVERVISDRFPGNPSQILGLLFDPISSGSYYVVTIKSLLQSFWAKFGWAHVILVGYRPYTILGIFTLAGLLGAIIAFFRHRNEIRWDIFAFFGSALVAVWGAAFFRGFPSILEGTIFIPVARYAYPVIIPTMLILNVGWLEIIKWVERLFRIPQKYSLSLLIFFFVLLDILSIYSIYNFFHQ